MRERTGFLRYACSWLTEHQSNDVPWSAGADIKELRELTFVEAYMNNFLQDLNDAVTTTRKPIIAAVSGYAVRKSATDSLVVSDDD